MGDIYAAAQVTLIAAAGSDPDFGLPGVSTSSRAIPQSERIGNALLMPVQRPTTLAEVARSQWASRAWTFQEFHRSRRRLIFTEGEAIFVCNSGIRYETALPRDIWGEEGEESDSYWLQQWLPQCAAVGNRDHSWTATMDRAAGYLEAYSKRHLTYDTDALDAIAGALDPLAQASTYHIWGAAFHRTYEFPCTSNSMISISLSSEKHWEGKLMRESILVRKANTDDSSLECELASMLWEIDNLVPWDSQILGSQRIQRDEMALLWYHAEPCRRRLQFPSWSSLAWSGFIHWYREDTRCDPRTFLAHLPKAKLRFAHAIYELASFVPTRDNSFIKTPPRLEFAARTVHLEMFHTTTMKGYYDENEFLVALILKNYFQVGLPVYWDTEPELLLGKRLKGALVYGVAGASLEAFMIVIAESTSLSNVCERVGIVKLPEQLHRRGYPVTHQTKGGHYRSRLPPNFWDSEKEQFDSLREGTHGLYWHDIFEHMRLVTFV
ncbi:hypothetical protein BKA58DRAFT_381025 [Alternaria rosae]|uniref:uncharacterized protein n=1 Tax=Alternaria rosae TaxID=1187941 RepID=UPI001E8DB115|nr:uncharacterized protein BKA58DRAFT_381025 [Alternaria rosae]KAH6876098.1 hypothetical protein BKA58DRAFT_381025 [Alternaria rosae]